MKKTGVLLINLGTPDAASVPAVRRYLREFLSDPYVIDIPALPRWLLLNLVILPFRTKQSTEAYQQIWTAVGSPLLTHSQAIANELQAVLGEKYLVGLGMRYGKPALTSTLKNLLSQELERLIVVPLYPQYAESTTRTSTEAIKKHIQKINNTIPIVTIREFYQQTNYIQANARLIHETIDHYPIEKLIFSYHGLPERHIKKTCHALECDLKAPCPAMSADNQDCYRAQCYATSRRIAEVLDLSAEDYVVTFQSRLGKAPWIKPYTDVALEQLAASGVKNIAIVCPSFVADCLETLEEIDIRAKAQWHALGGESLIRVPCLNDDKRWIGALANMIRA